QGRALLLDVRATLLLDEDHAGRPRLRGEPRPRRGPGPGRRAARESSRVPGGGAGALRPRRAGWGRVGRVRGKNLIVGGVLALAAATGCTADDAGPAVPVDPAVIYAQNCARCHGPDGRGDAELKKTMPTIRDFSDPVFLAKAQTDDLVRTIMAGKGQ